MTVSLEGEAEFAAAALLAADGDLPAVCFDDFFGDGQAQARAAGLVFTRDSEELLEDPAQMLAGDSHAGVADDEAHELFLRLGAKCARGRRGL